jgi:hypothetical protein
MLTSLLLEKLLEIERSVGHTDPLQLRAMLMEAEADVLLVQAEMIGLLQESARLREQCVGCERPALTPVSAPVKWKQRVRTFLPQSETQTA